ncbi:class I SAM-dependent methyltransferase [Kineococcus glutinatus]|uniref:Class I SAM-dependent methyltransferase n=1 Tax=Kineococcus glutinatus TaxID=1070872 RepID=A0ABP9H8B1_9ACTN
MTEQGRFTGLAATFDTVAELYERVRPTYPRRLFDDLAAAVGPGTPRGTTPVRVLEIGAGTGKATRGLLALGWSVVALEPGRELAAVARRVLAGLGDVAVVGSAFEGWRPPAGPPFDVVFAATAWHWLDQRVAFSRAAELLRPGGVLAIVATEHVLPEGGDGFFREVERVYDAVGMGDGKGGPQPPEAVPAPDVDAIRASGEFTEPEVHRYVWDREYPVEEYLALLSSYSGHIAASPRQREELFAGIRALVAPRPSGSVRKHHLNLLQLARRAG